MMAIIRVVLAMLTVRCFRFIFEKILERFINGSFSGKSEFELSKRMLAVEDGFFAWQIAF
jgi:hypothetical protein